MKTPEPPPAVPLQARRTYTEHAYEYVEHGGTSVSSSSLGVPEHEVVKTLVMETDKGEPLWCSCTRPQGVDEGARAPSRAPSASSPASPRRTRHRATSSAAARPRHAKAMPVHGRTILELPRIYINGGRRGYLLGMAPARSCASSRPSLLTWGAKSNLSSPHRRTHTRMHANEPGLPLPDRPRTTPAPHAGDARPQGAAGEGQLGGRRLAALPQGEPHVDRLPRALLPHPLAWAWCLVG